MHKQHRTCNVATCTCSLHFIEIVKMSTDDDSKTIVSNNVESEVNKLYLKITNKDDTIKVIVAKNANVSQL